MGRSFWGYCILLVVVVPAWGLTQDNIQPDQTPAAQYKQVKSDYSKLESQWAEDLAKLKSKKEREQFASKRPDATPFAAQIFEIAEKFPKDSSTCDALFFVVEIMPAGTKQSAKALDLIAENHLAQPLVARSLNRLEQNPAAEKLLRSAFEKHPDKDVQALAAFYLARNLKMQSNLPEKNPQEAAAARQQAETLYDRVIKDFGTLKDPNVSSPKSKGRTLRELAEPELFEVRFLSIGSTVLDIEADDLDGKAFKLSDYQGKVVLLDFWGHW
jgi:hypothetical protein